MASLLTREVPGHRVSMSRRSRWLLGTAVAFVACVLVVWSIVAPGAQPEVKLVFIGYSNSPIVHGGPITTTFQEGWFMVTNTGSVPAKLFRDIRALPPLTGASSSARFDGNTGTSNFAWPLYTSSPGSLKPGEDALRPGEALLLRVMVSDAGNPWNPWYTELAYCRHGLGTRMNDAVGKNGNGVVQGVLKRLSPLPDKQWAQSGWITNRPPAAP